jgi:hypothetical protein
MQARCLLPGQILPWFFLQSIPQVKRVFFKNLKKFPLCSEIFCPLFVGFKTFVYLTCKLRQRTKRLKTDNISGEYLHMPKLWNMPTTLRLSNPSVADYVAWPLVAWSG